uniref:Cytochrome c-553 n=1 Tax=Dipterosiphonia australica TaxID=2007208 RepID=A0A1Z1MLW1_9FLOR|nr:cytochrome c553 [Dipterosiphonia australica]ARW66744.1 cytochrome c553 [Dipterosiphonia australica]
MRFILSLFLGLFAACFCSFYVVLAQEVDLDAGQQVFVQNCAACHSGGENSVNPIKTLKLEDLNKYGKDTVDKIIYQVENGAGAMPAFSERLSGEEISSVANFVLSQAKNNSW